MINNHVAGVARHQVVGEVVFPRQGLVQMISREVCIKPVGTSLMLEGAARVGALVVADSCCLSVVEFCVGYSSWHDFGPMHCSPVAGKPASVVVMWESAPCAWAYVTRWANREPGSGGRVRGW